MTATKKTTKKTSQSKPIESSAGNVDQIREILFGQHIREVSEQFSNVESNFKKEISTLGKTIDKRVIKLEKFLGEHKEQTTDQMVHETKLREKALHSLQDILSELRTILEQQLSDTEGRLTARLKRLQDKVNKLGSDQTHRSDQIEHNKANREDLAKLFNQVAEKLMANPSSNK